MRGGKHGLAKGAHLVVREEARRAKKKQRESTNELVLSVVGAREKCRG